MRRSRSGCDWLSAALAGVAAAAILTCCALAVWNFLLISWQQWPPAAAVLQFAVAALGVAAAACLIDVAIAHIRFYSMARMTRAEQVEEMRESRPPMPARWARARRLWRRRR